MADVSDDVVLRFAIKGVPPEQTRQVAEQLGRDMVAEIAKINRNIEELEAKYRRARTDRTANAVQQEIESEKKKLSIVAAVAKEQEAAAKKAADVQVREAQRAADAQEREAIRAANAQAREAARAAREQEQWNDKIQQAKARAAREEERSQQRLAQSWRRSMEDLENITTVAEGFWKVVEIPGALIEKAKEYMEQVTKVTGIYNSAMLPEEQRKKMAEASGGKISNQDIIKATNYAQISDLKLTQEQYNLTAEAADRLTQAMGGEAKDAINTFYESMASGNVKALRHMGVIVDTGTAYEKYAERMRTSVDLMDDAQKKEAVRDEILAQLEDKLKKLPPEVDNFAEAWERAAVRSQNAADKIKVAVGNIPVPTPEQVKSMPFVPNSQGVGVSMDQMAAARRIEEENIRKGNAARDARIVERYMAAARSGSDLGFAYEDVAPAPGAELPDMSPEARAADMRKQVEETRAKQRDEADRHRQSRIKDAATAKAAAEKEEAERQKAIRLVEGVFRQVGAYPDVNAPSLEAIDAQHKMFMKGLSDQDLIALLGDTKRTDGGELRSIDEMAQEALGSFGSYGAKNREALRERTIRVNDAASAKEGLRGHRRALSDDIEAYRAEGDEIGLKRAQEALDSLTSKQESVLQKAGGKGLLTQLMWGKDGPDKAWEQMTDWEKSTIEVLNVVNDAGHKMAGALGSAMAAAVAGSSDQPLKVRLANIAKEIAAEAYLKSLLYGAEALGYMAMQNYPAAAQAGMAAAAFAAVGTAAGLGSRLMGGGTHPTATQATKTAGYTDSGRSGFNSAGGGNAAPVNIYVQSLPGDTGRTGRAIVEYIENYQRQSGRKVLAA